MKEDKITRTEDIGILITKTNMLFTFIQQCSVIVISRNLLLRKNAKSHWTGLAKCVLPSNHVTQYSYAHLKDLRRNASDQYPEYPGWGRQAYNTGSGFRSGSILYSPISHMVKVPPSHSFSNR